MIADWFVIQSDLWHVPASCSLTILIAERTCCHMRQSIYFAKCKPLLGLFTHHPCNLPQSCVLSKTVVLLLLHLRACACVYGVGPMHVTLIHYGHKCAIHLGICFYFLLFAIARVPNASQKIPESAESISAPLCLYLLMCLCTSPSKISAYAQIKITALLNSHSAPWQWIRRA